MHGSFGCNTRQIILRLVASSWAAGFVLGRRAECDRDFTEEIWMLWFDVGGAIDPVTSMAFQGRLAVAH